MSSAGFVHLHVHSAYSLLKGSIKIAKLGELAKGDRQPVGINHKGYSSN